MVKQPSIFRATVMHKRLFPKINRFTYRVFYVCLPLSKLDTLDKFIAYNRSSWLSFHDKDHGKKDGSSLQAWIQTTLQTYGLDKNIENIVLITMPRMLGYGFNPVSFWLCIDKDQQLRAVLSEVNNTFGETHSYLCANQNHTPISKDDVLTTKKTFHVSPFLVREGHYEFRFHYKDNALAIWIDYFNKENQKQLITSLTGHTVPLTKKNLLLACIRCPLVPMKTIMLIHWNALKLVIKRIRYIPKPKLKSSSLTTNLTKM